MSVAEALEPNDVTDAELAPDSRGASRKRRLVVVEEPDPTPVLVVVVASRGTGKAEAVKIAHEALAEEEGSPWIDRASPVRLPAADRLE